ncbi:MAG TPA: MFS transporter [Vicinamibacterales bacterium]|nr:MFS transporter [Vicinamibacterales bacterium]
MSIRAQGAQAAQGAWRMLGVVSLAQFLGMTLWFSATAVTPLLIDHFSIAPERAPWLTMAVQGGFVIGTLFSALTNVADILNARVLMFIGALAGACANAGLLVAPNGGSAIALRFVTGASLALVYPPAMKIAAGWFRDGRGFALGLLIGALTLGKAFPHLLSALFGTDWRGPLMLASGLAVIGGTLVVLMVKDGPYVAATSPFDPHAIRRVLASRGARLATLGYLGHMWELYAMWTWVAVFAWTSLTDSGIDDVAAAGSIAAFLAIGSGAAGCVLAGFIADRVGKARVAMWAMIVSASCAALTVVVHGRSPALLYALIIVWGFAVVADSAQFSALVSEHAPREHVGTALTMQVCLGFLLTMVTIELLPRVADYTGWRYASLVLVPGPLLGAWAMFRMQR